MEFNKTDKNEHGIANFMALETAIANNEKSYLLDLAQLNSNATIKKLLKDIPIKQS